jgi:hypothetical protein
MSRLVGLRGSGQYKWQWFLLNEYRKLPPRARWLGLASLLASVIAIVFAIGFALHSSQETSAAPLKGAIFTTTPDGGIVNENVHYENKIEVYLDGGPGPNAPKTAAGLPNGEYYFQVTDPSGKVLLSEDPAKCRKVQVTDGVIVALLNPTATYDPKGRASSVPCHVQDPPDPFDPAGPDDAGPSGRHDTNTDKDHGPPAIVVQLMPFLDTPNPGGVYKVWIIPAYRYSANDGDPDAIPGDRKSGLRALKVKGQVVGFQRDPGFGPPRDQVKTDNFKVKEFFPPEITVRKFHDINGNGVWDASEPEIGVDECVEVDGTLDTDCDTGGGWPIDITDPTSVTNGYYTPVLISAEPPGTWVVEEETFSPMWAQSVAILDGVPLGIVNPVSVTVAGTSGETHEVIFGNFMPGEKHGQKFIDLNGNGERDEDDGEGCPTDPGDVNYPGCVNVTVNLDGTDNMNHAVHLTTKTCGDIVPCPLGTPNGSYWFTGLWPGSYTVTVVEPEGFECSYPNACEYEFDIESGDVEVGNDFGDLSRAEIYGLKFHDLDGDGQPREPSEPPIADVTIHLDGTDGMGRPVSLTTYTCGGMVDCMGEETGSYWFTDLWPGDYTVTEDPPVGLICTFPDSCSYTLTLESDEVVRDLDFGNAGPCNGLTPGYWKNWDNHYKNGQMKTLLQGTIADINNSIAEANAIFDHWAARPGDELSILKAMTLANQLTINLTSTDLPNPSEGSLFGFCTLPDDDGENLAEILETALDYIDRLENTDPFDDPSRDEILSVAYILDRFANLRTS